MIKRHISSYINKLKKSFPVVVVTGPRQSGKTTLIKNMFPDYEYHNLENPQTFNRIKNDPAGFINIGTTKIIIDEVQRIPELLSYIQVTSDDQQLMGNFILSGSENILLSEKISQSLAGRAAYVNLLPLSLDELKDVNKSKNDVYDQIFTGCYPAIYDKNIDPITYFEQYIATYVERDVKQISNIINLNQFRKFLGLLVGRVGQVINYASLANDVGVAPNTVENWISILEASYIVFRLQPYYENFGKRHIKSPKIYFSDTGLACRLLELSSTQELKKHFLIGGLFENLVILEVKKNILNFSKTVKLYYFRDTNNNEVDLLIDQGLTQIPIEIKSGATFSSSYIKGIKYWTDLTEKKNTPKKTTSGFIIYTGNQPHISNKYSLLNWGSLESLFKLIN